MCVAVPSHSTLGLPALSPTMQQGNIAKWTKKEGDALAAGDIIAQIETDKATMDWELTDGGYLAKILIPEGSKDIPVGKVDQMINVGHGLLTDWFSSPRSLSLRTRRTWPSSRITLELRKLHLLPRHSLNNNSHNNRRRPLLPPLKPQQLHLNLQPLRPAHQHLRLHRLVGTQLSPNLSCKSHLLTETLVVAGRVVASPLAKKVAQEQGINLAGISGTGPNARIVRADVLEYAAGTDPILFFFSLSAVC